MTPPPPPEIRLYIQDGGLEDEEMLEGSTPRETLLICVNSGRAILRTDKLPEIAFGRPRIAFVIGCNRLA
jgi:hypothetical protein